MNDDSDESEYVDDNASGSDARTTRGEPAKSKKTLKKNYGIKPEATRESSAIIEDYAENSVPGHHITTTKSVLRSYRDHLNSTISEITGNDNRDANHDNLEPSQIGASFWTTQEKHKFFAALQSRGPGDLLALATAVGTKSEPEIKTYILLLQQGARELQAKSRLELASADLPAAAEIGGECLQAEEAAAGALEARARAVEEEREGVRWGEELWLVDADVAEALDEQYENAVEQDDAAEQHGNVEDDANPDPTARTRDEPDATPPTSFELLKASTLLQLSRSVFMNSKDPPSNWHTLAKDDPTGRLGPSIRRTTLEDFHNLVVSLTRRLMQVSIFQALSRLRASSDPRVQPNVHVFDVVAARETMGLKIVGPEYWARAVKKCGVEVYADAKKYRAEDGRKGTKVGYKLSEDELRVRLGMMETIPKIQKRADDTSDDAIQEDNDNDNDDKLDELDSDAYTDTGSSNQSLPDNNNNDDDDLSENSDEESKPRRTHHRRTGSKNRLLSSRKRPLSPASFARAETRHLEALDRTKNTAGENELRAVLGLDFLPEREGLKPDFPFKQAGVETRVEDWRDRVQYEAPWEQAGGVPGEREFEGMGFEGERRRRMKRRKVVGGLDGVVELEQGELGVGAEGSGGEEVEESGGEEAEEDDDNGESDSSGSERDRSVAVSAEEEED